MKKIGFVGKPHGNNGVVKVIPEKGMADLLLKNGSAIVVSPEGYISTLENIKEYNRGRFLGTISEFAKREDVKGFQGGTVMINAYQEEI